MYKGIYEIDSNIKIADNIFKMVLIGDTSSILSSGQFINIKLDEFYLRRPISICDYDDNSITIIYKVVGNGTDYMSRLLKGKKLDIICGLGNGYSLNLSVKNPLVIGGGVGIPPLYNLTKRLLINGFSPKVLLGFNSANESFFIDEFKSLNCELRIATVDGSLGKKGFVTNIIPNDKEYDYFFACGPIVMLKSVCSQIHTKGQISLEERMGCGFGACMGCSIKTKKGFKRVCKEGPVFEKDDIIW